MNSIISQMLSQHPSETQNDKKNSIKEVVQEIVLCGLSRAGLFKEAAFYGGTALRIFYGLDRFSEDLDFSLMSADPDFRIDAYLLAVERELLTYGLLSWLAVGKNSAYPRLPSVMRLLATEAI